MGALSWKSNKASLGNISKRSLQARSLYYFFFLKKWEQVIHISFAGQSQTESYAMIILRIP